MTPLLSMISGTRAFGMFGGKQSVFPARYFIFSPSAIKGGGGDTLLQLGEFNLMNGGTRITSANYYAWNRSFSPAADAGSSFYPSNETPSMANDGTSSTKWLDSRGPLGGLFIDLGTPTVTTGYQMYTANDGEWRDPKSWEVWASKDNSSYTLVSSLSNQSLPSSRYVYAGGWNWISGV